MKLLRQKRLRKIKLVKNAAKVRVASHCGQQGHCCGNVGHCCGNVGHCGAAGHR